MHSTYHAWEELCVWLELSHSSTQRAWGRERERGSEAAHYGLSSFPLMAGEEETVGGGSKGGATNREVAAPACREGGGPSVLRRADRSSLLCSARMLQPPPSFSLSLCSYFHSLSLVFFSPPLWYSMFISLSPSVSFFPPSLFLSPLACCHVLCAVPAFLRESRERMMEGKADRQRKGSSESDWNTDACVFKFDVSWTAFPKRLGQTVSEIADKIWLDSLLLLYVFV